MGFELYAQLGREIVSGWGIEKHGKSNSQMIEGMDAERKALCVLAALVEGVKSLNHSVLLSASGPRPTPAGKTHEDHSANAMLAVLTGRHIGVGIPDGYPEIKKRFPGLSYRAIKAIRKIQESGITHTSQLTKDSLLELRNVGMTTACEIMEQIGCEAV